MNKLESEIVFNRALIWLVLMVTTENKSLCILYALCAVTNLVKSCLKYVE